MTLGQVLSEIEVQYKKSYETLEGFLYLDEVSSFVWRRKSDLETFKELTARYSLSTDIIDVLKNLKKRKVDSKLYGGICMKKGAYFEIPEKVQKALKDAFNDHSLFEEEPVVNYNNPDYAIFDELSPKELQELSES